MSRAGDDVRTIRRTLVVFQALALVGVSGWIVLTVVYEISEAFSLPPWLGWIAIAAVLMFLAFALVLASREELRTSIDEGHTAGGLAGVVVPLVLVSLIMAASFVINRFTVSAGLVFSILAIVLLGASLIDCARRLGRFPGISYGGHALSQRETRRVWALFLLLTFQISAEGFGIEGGYLSHTWSNEAAPRYIPDDFTVRYREAYPLPFLTFEIREERSEDDTFSGSSRFGATIPVLFFVTLLLYWLLAIRWSGPSETVGKASSVFAARSPPDGNDTRS